MGYWSDLDISMHEDHTFRERDTFVCSNCVVDEFLANTVSSEPESNSCDYCGNTENPSIAFNNLMGIVLEVVSLKFADAQEINTPWVEGHWFVPDVGAYEVLDYVDPGWGDVLLRDLLDSMDPDKYWVEHTDRDWSLLSPNKALSSGWESFKEHVSTKQRSLFLQYEEDVDEFPRPDEIPIKHMLDAVGSVCKECALLTSIEVGNEFYRVRAAKEEEAFADFSSLSAPPPGTASAGRANWPGVSLLYIARSLSTAKREVLDSDTKFYAAKFVSSQCVRLLDFTKLPPLPSKFDVENQESLHAITFLKKLKADYAKPVIKDGKEHVEYVPTQIMSEYFRFIFRDEHGEAVDGIMYPSVKDDGGVNIVIFEADLETLESKFSLTDFWEGRICDDEPQTLCPMGGLLECRDYEGTKTFKAFINGLCVAMIKVTVGEAHWHLADVLVNDFNNVPFWRKVLPNSKFKNYRGRGIGSWLLNQVIVNAKNEGVPSIVGRIKGEDEKLRIWYQKFGFIVKNDLTMRIDLR